MIFRKTNLKPFLKYIQKVSKSKDIEKIHLKFLKLILGVKKSTSSMAVYGEAGSYPLYIQSYIRIIK